MRLSFLVCRLIDRSVSILTSLCNLFRLMLKMHVICLIAFMLRRTKKPGRNYSLLHKFICVHLRTLHFKCISENRGHFFFWFDQSIVRWNIHKIAKEIKRIVHTKLHKKSYNQKPINNNQSTLHTSIHPYMHT